MPADTLSTSQREGLIDALRSCRSTQERLAFAKDYAQTGHEPLWELICDLLISRSISRAVAAHWLKDLIEEGKAS